MSSSQTSRSKLRAGASPVSRREVGEEDYSGLDSWSDAVFQQSDPGCESQVPAQIEIAGEALGGSGPSPIVMTPPSASRVPSDVGKSRETAADRTAEVELRRAKRARENAEDEVERIKRRWRPGWRQFFASLSLIAMSMCLFGLMLYGGNRYLEYRASLPPDLFDIEDPSAGGIGDYLGYSRQHQYDPGRDVWNALSQETLTLGVYVVTVNTHELVAWTQKYGEDAADNEVLAKGWTWLATDEDRKAWPVENQGDLEICGDGELLAWSKVVDTDGLARVSRTGIDGKTVKTIETVKGGAYWCTLNNGEGEDDQSYRLVTRWYPSDGSLSSSVTTSPEDGEPSTAIVPDSVFEEHVAIAAFTYGLNRGN